VTRSYRLLLSPVLLAGAAVGIVLWAHSGAARSDVSVLATGELAQRVWEHMKLCAVSTALAVAVAVPGGIAATRPGSRRLATPLLFVANVGQSVPTIAVLALAFSVTGIGFRTAVIGLWAYSLLPVLRNTVAGLGGVDPAVTEAARGMGMSPVQVLRKVELPLAWPVILAGIRTAAVVNVGTAALATFVGAGGLGDLITVGLDNQRDRILYTGAALTAVLALTVDWAVGFLGGFPAGGQRESFWHGNSHARREEAQGRPAERRGRAGTQ
jgi:osmoprotectant transport system permease protein